jgi:hypothetical protein
MSPDERRRYYSKMIRLLWRAQQLLKNPQALALLINRRLAKIDNGALIRAIVETRFLTAGASGGQNWPALATSTQKQRAAQGFGAAGPILERSQMLRMGAINGKLSWDADTITLEFKDGGAPRYIGNGRARKKKVLRGAAEAMDMARMAGLSATGNSNRLSDYAGALNEKRPFYGEPTDNELREVYAARDRILAAIIDAIVNGRDIDSTINATS